MVSDSVAASFALENVATIALAVNLVTYFNGVMHYSIADAANQLTNYMGTAYILSIIVAFLADTYIGRFYAVLLSAFIELGVYMLEHNKQKTMMLEDDFDLIFNFTLHADPGTCTVSRTSSLP